MGDKEPSLVVTWRIEPEWLVVKNLVLRQNHSYFPLIPKKKMPKEKKEKKSKTLESGLEDVQMGDAAASKVGQFVATGRY